jgi:hypothetical protein
MPEKLSPKYGVPKEETLDTFHKTTKALGVPIKVNEIEGAEIPLTLRGYDQLLRTIAQIVQDSLGFMHGVKKINLLRDENLGGFMGLDGTLKYHYIDPLTETGSLLGSVDNFAPEWSGSLRNKLLIAQHEGIHNFLINLVAKSLSTEGNTPTLEETIKFQGITNSIMSAYIEQLRLVDPLKMERLPTLLTNYFEVCPQELFTTLLEAVGTEVASRRPISDKMAKAVGSTVADLEKRKNRSSTNCFRRTKN